MSEATQWGEGGWHDGSRTAAFSTFTAPQLADESHAADELVRWTSCGGASDASRHRHRSCGASLANCPATFEWWGFGFRPSSCVLCGSRLARRYRGSTLPSSTSHRRRHAHARRTASRGADPPRGRRAAGRVVGRLHPSRSLDSRSVMAALSRTTGCRAPAECGRRHCFGLSPAL